jgi:hypothetical protein
MFIAETGPPVYVAFFGVRAIFVTLLLRVALGNFVTLMGIGESSSL